MIEIIDKNKLYNAVIIADDYLIKFEIQSKDGKESYNKYIDWNYLGFDEYPIGIEDLMIVYEFDLSVNIESIDKSILNKAIKQTKKTFKRLYKENKKNIIEFIEDAL